MPDVESARERIDSRLREASSGDGLAALRRKTRAATVSGNKQGWQRRLTRETAEELRREAEARREGQ